jgi:hypothetical protein
MLPISRWRELPPSISALTAKLLAKAAEQRAVTPRPASRVIFG